MESTLAAIGDSTLTSSPLAHFVKLGQAFHSTLELNPLLDSILKQLQSIVPHIPLDMLLLETDSPYLTPIPHRGERNEPKYLPHSAETIARLMGVDIMKIEKQTSANAMTVFYLV